MHDSTTGKDTSKPGSTAYLVMAVLVAVIAVAIFTAGSGSVVATPVGGFVALVAAALLAVKGWRMRASTG